MTRSTYSIRCPVCHSERIQEIIDLPRLPARNTILWPSAGEAKISARGDIRLAFCIFCGHVYNSILDPDLIAYRPTTKTPCNIQAFSRGMWKTYPMPSSSSM